MGALVVARDGYVDEAERAVGVAERDDGDVDVGRLGDGLVVGARVRHDEEPRLAESGLWSNRKKKGGFTTIPRLNTHEMNIFYILTYLLFYTH